MPSDFGRGLRFGMGFAVGLSIVVGFFLFGVSMCAGHFQQRIFEELKEQLEESIPPGQRPQGEKEKRVSFPSAVQVMAYQNLTSESYGSMKVV